MPATVRGLTSHKTVAVEMPATYHCPTSEVGQVFGGFTSLKYLCGIFILYNAKTANYTQA